MLSRAKHLFNHAIADPSLVLRMTKEKRMTEREEKDDRKKKEYQKSILSP